MPVLRQAEGVLQLGTARQDGPPRGRTQWHGLRDVAAGAAQHGLLTAEGADHRVVRADVDGPVVGEERVGDPLESGARVVVEVGDRLVGDVAAGEHDRGAHCLEEQVVQRAVGQHHAELPVAGRRRGGHGGVGPAGEQHDGPASAGEQVPRRGVQLAQLVGLVHIGHHDGERLVLTVFAGAQRGSRSFVASQHGQVIAADSLDRQYLPGPQLFGSAGDGSREARPAAGAARGLGVKPPVRRVVVLVGARHAHRKPGHGGERPVVGNVADDREPRTAVGAVDERVAEAAVGRVGQLAEAVGAGSGVGGDERVPGPSDWTGHDREPRCPSGGRGGVRDPFDLRERRPVAQRGDELRHVPARPFDLGEHPVDVVAHMPGEPEPSSERVHERPIPDALNHTLDPHHPTNAFVHPPSVGAIV